MEIKSENSKLFIRRCYHFNGWIRAVAFYIRWAALKWRHHKHCSHGAEWTRHHRTSAIPKPRKKKKWIDEYIRDEIFVYTRKYNIYLYVFIVHTINWMIRLNCLPSFRFLFCPSHNDQIDKQNIKENRIGEVKRIRVTKKRETKTTEKAYPQKRDDVLFGQFNPYAARTTQGVEGGGNKVWSEIG